MSHPEYKKYGTPLIRLIEECAEVIKVACKIQRFGLTNYSPYDPEKRPNIVKLKAEMADVMEAWSDYQEELAEEQLKLTTQRAYEEENA